MLAGSMAGNLLPADHAGGQPCAGEGVDVTAMEGIAFAGIGQPVDRLVDHTGLHNAAHPLDVGQGAVVRRDDVVPAAGLGHDAAPVAAHAWVHHAHEHAALGPVLHRLDQAVAGLPDVILGDVMGQIVYTQAVTHAFRHTVHGAHRTVRQAEVGLQDQGFHGLIRSFANGIAPGSGRQRRLRTVRQQ